jgi:hypothetical protein
MFGTRIPISELKTKDHDVFHRFGLTRHIDEYLINPSTAGLSSYLSDLPGEIDFAGHSLSSSLSKVRPSVNISDILDKFKVAKVAPNQIPVPDPIKQTVKVPMGIVDTSNLEEKKIFLRFKTSESKRKSVDEPDNQPLKKLKEDI